MESKFATCLNCIDGRVQIPVINWITDNYEIDYVDMVTEAGMMVYWLITVLIQYMFYVN